MLRLFFIGTFLFCFVRNSFSQSTTNETIDTTKYVRFYSFNDPLLLEDTTKIEDINRKLKKKRERGFLGIFKKRIFYGHRVRRGYMRSGFGTGTRLEQFHTLKVAVEPSKYIKRIHWFNVKKRKIEITKGEKVDPNFGLILHGPYSKTDRQGNILEEGSFYVGTKHKRWMEYNKNRTIKYKKDTLEVEIDQQILLKKVYYDRGWPKDAEITYYDKDKKYVKEVVPIVRGKKEGDYFKFYKNTWYQETGTYANDKKVGLWTEFHPTGRKTSLRKNETLYPKDPYDLISKPVLQREWNKKGKLTFDRTKKK
ncbi:MAG: hypothetical protein AB8B61_04155 [Cyclobacteriaceae bacterium]